MNNISQSEGLCVRVMNGEKMGVITSTVADPSRLPKLLKQAAEISESRAPDSFRRFGKFSGQHGDDIPVDRRLFSDSSDNILDKLESLERKILQQDTRLKKVIKLQYSEEEEQKSFEDDSGNSVEKRFSVAAFVVEVLAEYGGSTEVAWDFSAKRFSDSLSIERTAHEVASHSVLSLGASPISSGNYPIVFHPRVGSQILKLVSKALSAQEIQLGRSFMAGKLNQQVASSHVTLLDDPFLKEGILSAPFDDEGTPHETREIISGGTVESYFYDLSSAARDGVESTGNAIKENLSTVPKPHATNFYMKPSRSQVSDMLAAEPQVFYLQDVMGLHMADPITGEFSLGASGYLYKRGALDKPVRGVTVSGSLTNVMNRTIAVGDDLTWYGSFGCPSFLVSYLTVAGQ